MYVIALREAAVLRKPGSYEMRPKSSAPALIVRSSVACTAPSSIGSSYVAPVRLSVTVSELFVDAPGFGDVAAVFIVPSPASAFPATLATLILVLLGQTSRRYGPAIGRGRAGRRLAR